MPSVTAFIDDIRSHLGEKAIKALEAKENGNEVTHGTLEYREQGGKWYSVAG
jgi:hypothetical protein